MSDRARRPAAGSIVLHLFNPLSPNGSNSVLEREIRLVGYGHSHSIIARLRAISRCLTSGPPPPCASGFDQHRYQMFHGGRCQAGTEYVVADVDPHTLEQKGLRYGVKPVALSASVLVPPRIVVERRSALPAGYLASRGHPVLHRPSTLTVRIDIPAVVATVGIHLVGRRIISESLDILLPV